jgi:hypothetical protein
MTRPQSETAPFVDLYDLLDVSPGSDVAAIRKRITSLYIEAQNNLDHRNFRKRFYYQELFETYLPQAHYLLLNEARRAIYDGQLQAHHQHTPGDSGELRFDKAPPAPELEAAQSTSASHARPTTTDVPADKSPSSALPSTSTPRVATPDWMRMDAGRVERRRDFKRRALIQQELENAGLFWGLIGGWAVVVLLGMMLYVTIDSSPGGAMRPLGLPWGAFSFLCFVALLSLGVSGARTALRYARRRIVSTLSRMPYEQLLHRCGRG